MYQYVLYGTVGGVTGSIVYKHSLNKLNSFNVKNYNNAGLFIGVGLGCLYAYKIQK
jgi:hypothetical protein